MKGIATSRSQDGGPPVPRQFELANGRCDSAAAGRNRQRPQLHCPLQRGEPGNEQGKIESYLYPVARDYSLGGQPASPKVGNVLPVGARVQDGLWLAGAA